MCPSMANPPSLSEGLSEGQGEEEDDAKDWRMIRHYYRISDLPEVYIINQLSLI